MNINNPIIKKISLKEYEERFLVQLKEATHGICIFFRIISNIQTIELSFSFDNFIIITSATFKEMRDIFPKAKNDLDVKVDEKYLNFRPEAIKFLKHYALDRGIQEQDE